MRSDSAIEVEGLGKSYRIKAGRDRHAEEFWAVRDLDFRIREGEVVGVVGHNGAGKSTLLKLLSRITHPSEGRIRLRGRVGSLLEVGTGFHPELSGRENIWLNGAILGMNRAEIRKAFDEIVSFAGVERFLETPVKRYSSGMYVRLAFAVAAHLQPEILIVDEVLAVGDAEFQAKCLGKMQDVSRSGRTVLFVSHNLASVGQMCGRVIVLHHGRVDLDGPTPDGIRRYFELQGLEGEIPSVDKREGKGTFRFTSVQMESEAIAPTTPTRVRFEIERVQPGTEPAYVSAHVVDEQGRLVAQCDGRFHDAWLKGDGPFRGELEIRGPWLVPGNYKLVLELCDRTSEWLVDRIPCGVGWTVLADLPYPVPASDDGWNQGLVLADFTMNVSHRAR